MLRQLGWRYKSVFKRPFFWYKSSAPDTGVGEVFAQHEFYSNIRAPGGAAVSPPKLPERVG